MFGGLTTPPTTYRAFAEEWNGSAWTEVGDLNTARSAGGFGQNAEAALAFGGYTGTAASGATESWNGSAWTEVNDLNTAREQITGSGEYTDAVGFTGNPPTAKTEVWNGTTWVENSDLNSARKKAGPSGTSTAALAFSGQVGDSPSGSTLTEEWSGSSNTTKTVSTD